MKRSLILDNELKGEYLEQIWAIDRAAYGIEPRPHQFAWEERKPWMYHLLREGEEVLGYTLVMPLRKSTYLAMKKGKIWEEELRVSDIEETSPEGLYLFSCAASPQIRFNKEPFVTGTLCRVLAGQLGRSAREVIATPINKTGQKIVEMLKMHSIPSELNISGMEGYSPQVFLKPPYREKTPLNIGN